MGCLIIVLCLVLLVVAPVVLVAILLWPLAAATVAEIKVDAAKREAEARTKAENVQQAALDHGVRVSGCTESTRQLAPVSRTTSARSLRR